MPLNPTPHFVIATEISSRSAEKSDQRCPTEVAYRQDLLAVLVGEKVKQTKTFESESAVKAWAEKVLKS